MTDAYDTAADVIRELVDERIPERGEETLLSDDVVVHLANAYQQIEFADASGLPLEMVPYDSVEEPLRQRCHDVLLDRLDKASDQSRWETLAGNIAPNSEVLSE